MSTKTTVTCKIEDVTGVAATSGTVEFQLHPDNSTTLFRVLGTATLAAKSVVGTINSSGLLKAMNGTDPFVIWGNDVVLPENTWYRVTYKPNGSQTQVVNFMRISGATYNLASAVFTQNSNDSPVVLTADAPVTPQQFANQTPYGANSVAAIQLAVDYAVSNGRFVKVPGVNGGYLAHGAALDLHNLDNLFVEGDGNFAPAFSYTFETPARGSVIVGDTGTAGCMVDAVGANNVRLKGLTFSSLQVTDASTIGIIAGTSNRVNAGSNLGAPGGAGLTLEDVTFMLPQGNSMPIYCNNSNLIHLQRVWTLGDYGLIMVKNNDLTVFPPYGNFGSGGSVTIENDGNTLTSCNFLGYGTAPVLYLKNTNCLSGNAYLATVRGGPTYLTDTASHGGAPGFAYAMYYKDCKNINLDIEEDYFPSMYYSEGSNKNVNISGVAYPKDTPVSSTIPLVGALFGTKYDNCQMNVTSEWGGGAAPNANFYYTTIGGAIAVVEHIKNCTFRGLDYVASPNGLFLNMTADEAVPLFSINIEGNSDSFAITKLVNNTSMAAGKYRYLLNQKAFGTG